MKGLVLSLWSLCWLPLTAGAHVPDQYLQLAQIALASDEVRIELRLIPGVEVADRIWRQIDTDGNGQLTETEEAAYAARVREDLAVALDGVQTSLRLAGHQFPTLPEVRAGGGTIRLTWVATTGPGAADHREIYFRNNHQADVSVYLVNALVPESNEISIRGQNRDPLQREMRLRYDLSRREGWEWQGITIFCLCLLLLVPQGKYLGQYWRRHRTGGQPF